MIIERLCNLGPLRIGGDRYQLLPIINRPCCPLCGSWSIIFDTSFRKGLIFSVQQLHSTAVWQRWVNHGPWLY